MDIWHAIEANIVEATGSRFYIASRQPLGGGCINECWLLGDGRQQYFVKLNQATEAEMFQAEADGLRELARAEAIRVPEVVTSGVSGGKAWLVLEALALGARGRPAELGERLAALHRHQGEAFGWWRDNTIGRTPQYNQRHTDWVTFWREQRLRPQLRMAQGRGAGAGLLDAGERLGECLPVLFVDYQPRPSLLHGDLWGGNYAYTETGEPVLFDPAVYYGDHEADLAMTELFGGFEHEFYQAYQQAWPLDAGYQVRKRLYNLYHVLNHYNLFGGGYANQAEGMLRGLLAEL